MSNPIVTDLSIIGFYDQQRFKQFGPSDCAGWTIVSSELGKKKASLYPQLGRKHIRHLDVNRLQFASEPRWIDESNNYWYAVVGDTIWRIDSSFVQTEITSTVKLTTPTGNIFFTYIVVSASAPGGGSVPGITFVVFADGQHLYLYREETGEFGIVTDTHLPANPWAVATFGNRIVVSTRNSATFGLSEINLNYNVSFTLMLTNAFTVAGATPAVFAQEEGIIQQMGVLQHTLYIFTDFTVGIWSNIPSNFVVTGGTSNSFPFQKNTSYNFDTGISAENAKTLDIDFGMMAWLGQNRNGINQPMITTGGKPKPISSKAVDVLLQRQNNFEEDNPSFLENGNGFLYDYENTIFYRLSSGTYSGTELLDQVSSSYSLEYNFDVEKWFRCIELNGERNRIQQHIFFGKRHLVTLLGEGTVYEMSGRFYSNEIRNVAQLNPQAIDAYSIIPFRYERVTNILVAGMIEGLKAPGFYAEFKTNYVEIDFVWGEETFINSSAPNPNAIFIIDEQPASDGEPLFMVSEADDNTFIISEEGNLPDANSPIYYNWFKPNIELLFSNDGGMSFQSAGQLEFSQLGVYQWRMRWYQLGCSRNRVYKLICVSPSPIVILGASMEVENASGGAA